MPYIYNADGTTTEVQIESSNAGLSAGWAGWLILLLFGLAIYGIYRYAKRKPPNAKGNDAPTGVGGWLRIIFGVILSILGVFLLSRAITNSPSNANFQFLLGYYLPSGAITAFGVLLLTWKMRNTYGLGNPIAGQPVQPDNEIVRKAVAIETTTPQHPGETMATPGNTELPTNVEDQIYTQIADELDSGNLDKAAWTKAYAASDGEDKKARSAYIKLRFERLASDMGKIQL